MTRFTRLALALALGGALAVPALGAPAPAQADFDPAQLDALAAQVRDLANQSFTPDLTIPIATTVATTKNPTEGASTDRFKAGCRISYQQSTLADADYTRELTIHEITHCYEFQLAPADAKLPDWAAEGAAEWVQAALVKKLLGPGYVSGNLQADWKDYFKKFTAPITAHRYSAMPYFAHMAELYGDAAVFNKITAMFKSPGSKAYGIFTGDGADEFLDTIASSGVRQDKLGKNWTTDGPMIPSPGKARYTAPSIAAGGGTANISAPAYGRAVVRLDPIKQVEVIKVTATTPGAARGLVRHEEGEDRLSGDGAFYCARGKCKCPDGRDITKLGDDAYLSLFADKKPAKVAVARSTIEEACKQAPSAMAVTGAFSMVVKERGACGLSSKQMGKAPLDALFTTGFSKARPRGLGSVHIQVSGAGPGTYVAAMNVAPPKSGVAGVTRFGDPGASWSAYNPIGVKPEIQNFGKVTVGSVGPDGASGTVSMTLVGEPPGQPSRVRLVGRWSCEPFDKILSKGKKKS